MYKSIASWILIIAPNFVMASTGSSAHFFSGDDQQFDIVGEAFSLKDQRLIYREFHRVDGNHHVVIYRDPKGNEFSRKTLDFSASDQAPSFKQYNRWSDETIAADNIKGGISLSYRNNRKNIDSTETLMTNNNLIIDAGFNRYITNNWQSLTNGQAAVFDFALADRQDLIALEIEQSDCQKIPATKSSLNNKPEKTSHNTVCFSIGADNRLIRWLIGSLNLVYAKDTQQLLRFIGLGNINDQQGKGLKVDIHYHYPPKKR